MKDDWAIKFGQAIVERRRQLRLTQRDLADLAEVSVPFLVALENGKTTARMDKAVAVLMTLGLELHIRPGREGVSVAD